MVKPGCEHDRDRYLEALKSIELELLELELDKHEVLAKKLPSGESDADLQDRVREERDQTCTCLVVYHGAI